MRVEHNVSVFGDLRPGDVFSYKDFVYVKIREIKLGGALTTNALQLPGGIGVSFSTSHAVISHPNAVLKLEDKHAG